MKTALIILAVIISLITFLYAYYDGFKKISIHVEKSGGETMVYESLTGDYINL
jgi:hypothetical protein